MSSTDHETTGVAEDQTTEGNVVVESDIEDDHDNNQDMESSSSSSSIYSSHFLKLLKEVVTTNDEEPSSTFDHECQFMERFCAADSQPNEKLFLNFFVHLEKELQVEDDTVVDVNDFVNQLWSIVESHMTTILDNEWFQLYLNSSSSNNDDSEVNDDSDDKCQLSNLLSFLNVVTELGLSYMKHLTKAMGKTKNKKQQTKSSDIESKSGESRTEDAQNDGVKRDVVANEHFLKSAVLLHDLLLILNATEEGVKLQSKISLLCESIYLAFPDNDTACDTVPNTIVYLLSESLLLSAKKTIVKRVYKMRSALDLLEYSESTILQDILMRTVISPLYLSTKEGIKFLAYAFNVDPSLPPLFHSAIVPQIPQADENTVSALGDLYFRSWKGAQSQTLLQIEHNCIQDLMFHAIHARNSKLFANLRLILNHFHSQKNQARVDEMLLRLYEPILFRSLNVANSVVRRNATCLFVDAFPLRDPELNREDSENLLQKQIGLLREVLMDECPLVRIAALEGLCKILTLYWEVFSSDDCFSLLKQLVSKLAFDSSSINVRVSVCKGLAYLLDNHLSHHALKSMSCLTITSVLIREPLTHPYSFCV